MLIQRYSPGQRRSLRIFAFTNLLLSSVFCGNAYAAVIEIYPSNADKSCNEQFENTANSLSPGDELVLHGGNYTQSCRRAITANGTAALPIIIRAADGESPVLTRPKNNLKMQNNIEIVNSSYLIIRGLRFQGGNSGVRLSGGNHITLDGNEIFETGNNALRANDPGSHYQYLFVRGNHIHHTGLSTKTEGEGMYLGCQDGSCKVTDSVIENNYIHDLRASSAGGNDGIEIKYRSYGNVVRDNVIHDTTLGTQYPCITVYGASESDRSDPKFSPNIIEGNAVWHCSEGIYVVSDAIVRNNLVFQSDSGIASYPHAIVPQMRNLVIVNNTVYGNSSECAYLNWSGTTGFTFANNALYCPSSTAVVATGLANNVIAANYVLGARAGEAAENSGFVTDTSGSPAFVDPGHFGFWPAPGSVLRATANSQFVPADDFNVTLRTSVQGFDVGAYETEGNQTNPGWSVGPGFKP